MFNFDMSLFQNVAIFYDGDDVVFVDSFDNKEFNVRLGTLEQSKFIGSVIAASSEELNQKLAKLVHQYQTLH